ncbi:hypothetical protein MTER_34420 [Mycolicibacter terrae]|uniref:Uncharacterized protein n=1 Tax=Mycolicibacter terrae TaxID=1788 RepID=A0AAD1I5J0_9MYCO|nr:hypothetical protein [Mycolicibacter terrae]BBX24031.1 hypothetical protein MTER_34420 [Mycolicibacter terrae]
MIKLLLIGAVIVLVLILVLAITAVLVVGRALTALDSAIQQWETRRVIRLEKARQKRAVGRASAALMAWLPTSAGKRLIRGNGQVDNRALPVVANRVADATPPKLSKAPVPHNTGLATEAPVQDFQSLCVCPHCGEVDTHYLRAPIRAAEAEPGSSQPEGESGDASPKLWWKFAGTRLGSDNPETSTPSPEPTADHPDADSVRTCRSCGHVWAQR